VRADSGFARDDLMAWCEDNGVHFLLGLAQNERLNAMIAGALAQAEAKSRRTGKPARRATSRSSAGKRAGVASWGMAEPIVDLNGLDHRPSSGRSAAPAPGPQRPSAALPT
jgi:Transposase DDE domain group 1